MSIGSEKNQKRIKRQEKSFRILRPLIRPIVKAIVNYSYEEIPEISGPYLLLCNHNTDLDPILLSVSARRALSFVATENITRMGIIGKLAVGLFDPVLHRKGKSGKKTVLSILSRIGSGRSVAMFPEGNRSFNGLTCEVTKTNARLIQSSGASLVTYRFEGGYFTSPRWGKGLRKGRIKGKLSGVYSPEKLKSMSLDEIYELLVKDIHVDAYADQKADPVRYRGKNRAEGMETAIFMCPKCRALGTLASSGNEVMCSCGYRAVYDEYGFLTAADGEKTTVTELDELQKKYLSVLSEGDKDKPVFSDHVNLRVINDLHEVVTEKKTELTAFPDRLVIDGKEYGFHRFEGLAVHRRNLLIVNVLNDENHYDVTGSESFSAVKYVYLFKEFKKKQTVKDK